MIQKVLFSNEINKAKFEVAANCRCMNGGHNVQPLPQTVKYGNRVISSKISIRGNT